MKTWIIRHWRWPCSAAGAGCLVSPAAPAAEPPAKVADDVQDFVFLGEARPVLVRLHVRIDGKPLQAAWDDCIEYLFGYLDVERRRRAEQGRSRARPTAAAATGGGVQARWVAAVGSAVAAGGRRRAGRRWTPSTPTRTAR